MRDIQVDLPPGPGRRVPTRILNLSEYLAGAKRQSTDRERACSGDLYSKWGEGL
jgi:hypothetical protein